MRCLLCALVLGTGEVWANPANFALPIDVVRLLDVKNPYCKEESMYCIVYSFDSSSKIKTKLGLSEKLQSSSRNASVHPWKITQTSGYVFEEIMLKNLTINIYTPLGSDETEKRITIKIRE